jgi:hypothetical protein
LIDLLGNDLVLELHRFQSCDIFGLFSRLKNLPLSFQHGELIIVFLNEDVLIGFRYHPGKRFAMITLQVYSLVSILFVQISSIDFGQLDSTFSLLRPSEW